MDLERRVVLLPLPKLTVENTENYRVDFGNWLISHSLLFTERHALFLQKSCIFSRLRKCGSMPFFPRNFDVFFAEQQLAINHWIT